MSIRVAAPACLKNKMQDSQSLAQAEILEAQQALAARQAALYYSATAKHSLTPPEPQANHRRQAPRARLLGLLQDNSTKRMRQREQAIRRAFSSAPNANTTASPQSQQPQMVTFDNDFRLHVQSEYTPIPVEDERNQAFGRYDDELASLLGELPRECVEVQLDVDEQQLAGATEHMYATKLRPNLQRIVSCHSNSSHGTSLVGSPPLSSMAL
ncbi:hypothetical protein BKA62DRAFT_710482 [Auriculariales sp. MPI-PUGE-AT-0066]|nr:hypothetical protein BKA62DRAFT_710482 [Auriculariales sp. MPI-PUGE-AT-0066]